MPNLLDNLKKISALDKENMYELIYHFPEQVQAAYKLSSNLVLSDWNKEEIKHIVACGMGGSAIGADVIRTYFLKALSVSFNVVRNYDLPGFVDEKSLVILCSYSGNTEETLSCLEQACRRKSKIISISSGGRLLSETKQKGLKYTQIPTGLPPRAALAYLFIPVLVALEKLTFTTPSKIDNTVEFLQTLRKNYSLEAKFSKNQAKKIAQALHQKITVIYSGPELESAAYRFKSQICENAKTLAFCNFFPEFNHNELVGWEKFYGFKKNLQVVIFSDEYEHSRIKVRTEIVKKILRKRKIPLLEISPPGEEKLERILSAIQLGDFVSFYLAILNQIDPTPVKVIDYLKSKLVTDKP